MAHFDLVRPDHAYAFGLLQSDGCHSAGPRGTTKGKVTVELSSRDAAVLHELQKLFCCYSSITRRQRETNFSTSSQTVVWGVFAESFRHELRELGMPPGRKSTSAAPPATAFSAPDYLRGLVDGDGSVGFTAKGYPFVSFTTASERLAQYFCAEAERWTGARRTFRRNRRDAVFNVMVACDPAATMARLIYPSGCLAIGRKRRSAEDVASWVRPSAMRARPTCRQPWTPEHDAVVRAIDDDNVVAERLGRTHSSVGMRRWRLTRTTPGTW